MSFISILKPAQIQAAMIFLLVMPASFLGWGLGFRRLSGMRSGELAVTITLGAGFVMFVGGWLNQLGIAYTPVAIAVLAIGLCLLFFLSRGPMFKDLIAEGRHFGWGGLILSLVIIVPLIYTQLPPWAYNPHDDLGKYFTWPTRMLATGTMVFSPTSAIGTESLGGQVILHGLTLSLLPANRLAGLDGLFGMVLCLFLALSITRNKLAQLLSAFAVVVIHPQVVNISTVYVGSAFIMAILQLSAEGEEQSLMAQAVLYAGLLACKPTFVVFAVFYIVAVGLVKASVRSAIESVVRTGIWSLFFLTPWILLHGHHWIEGIGYKAPDVAGVHQDLTVGLFSTKTLLYGASMMAYSTLVFGTAIVAVIVAWFTRKQKDKAHGILLITVGSIVVGHLFFYYVLGSLLTDLAMGVRYYAAILIALVPIVISLSLSRLANYRLGLALAATGFSLALVSFCPSFCERVSHLVNRHNQITFDSPDNNLILPTAIVLSGFTQQQLLKAQSMIPSGAPLLAWVDTPFQLDFGRNPIYDAEPAGMANSWAVLPKVRYMLWDKRSAIDSERRWLWSQANGGIYDKKIAARWFDFYRCIERIAKRGRLIHQEGNIEVYELPEDVEISF